MGLLGKFFGPSPFGQLHEHTKKVHECVELLKPLLNALLNEDYEKIEELHHQMSRTEYEADQIKSKLRGEIGNLYFLSVGENEINRFLTRDSIETGRFITMFFLDIDPSAQNLRWIRAGSDPAILYDHANDDFQELNGEGMALGVMEDFSFREYSRQGWSSGSVLLVGTDGREKMSKSVGNTIGINDAPEEIYGRTMSISDQLMLQYLRELGFGRWDDLAEPAEEVRAGGGDPLDLKQTLAFRLVERFRGTSVAQQASAHFRKVVQNREVPEEIPELSLPLGPQGDAGLLDVLRKAFGIKSNGEARRLVTQRAVWRDGELVTDPTSRLRAGTFLLRAGKRRYARVELRKDA